MGELRETSELLLRLGAARRCSWTAHPTTTWCCSAALLADPRRDRAAAQPAPLGLAAAAVVAAAAWPAAARGHRPPGAPEVVGQPERLRRSRPSRLPAPARPPRRPAAPSRAASGRDDVRDDHPGQRLGPGRGHVRGIPPGERCSIIVSQRTASEHGRRQLARRRPGAGAAAPRCTAPRSSRPTTWPRSPCATTSAASSSGPGLPVRPHPPRVRSGGHRMRHDDVRLPIPQHPTTPGGAPPSSTRSTRAASPTPTATASATCRHHRAPRPPGRARCRRACGCRRSTDRRRTTTATTSATTRASTRCSAPSPTSTRSLAEVHQRGMQAGHGPGRQPHLRRAPLVRRVALERPTTRSGTGTGGARRVGHRPGEPGAEPTNWGRSSPARRGSSTRRPASTTSTCSRRRQPDLNWENPRRSAPPSTR